MKKIVLIFMLMCLVFPVAEKANAQFSIGASYEVRNEEPTNGFGLRVESGILKMVPVVDFNLRGHFSYFNESNSASPSGAEISGDIDAFDYGVAATAGVKIAMLKPYVGFGIGSETIDFESDENQGSFRENNFYWNGFGGVEVRIIPLLNPFIEYRITKLTDTDQVNFDNVGRVAIGINLRF